MACNRDEDAVLAEFDGWVYAPGATQESTSDGLSLLVADDATWVLAADFSKCTVSETLAAVRRRAAERGSERIVWRVRARPTPSDLRNQLVELGGSVTSRTEVCAAALGQGVDIPTPAYVEVTVVQDADDLYTARRVGALAFGWPVPQREGLALDELDSDRYFTFLARIDGEPVGSAGYTLVGDVARLWGAGVVESSRGRGVYRAMLAARLADARRKGATLAIVQAQVDTSAPILRRLGFTVYGESCSVSFPPSI